MSTVYAVVFTNGIVKFGRAVNAHKRVGTHISEGKRHGSVASDVFLSTVSSDVRDERILLEAAREGLEAVSPESFRAGGLEDVASVFRNARIPFVTCKIEDGPYRLVLDGSSFDDMMIGREFSARVEKISPDYKKVLTAVSELKDFTIAEANSRISRMSYEKCASVVRAMHGDGLLSVVKPLGFEYNGKRWIYSVVQKDDQ